MRNLLHTYFCVTHGGRTIPVKGTEISLTINQGISHGEALGHSDDRIVCRGISMGMVFTNDITHDPRGFHIRAIVGVIQNIHGKQHAAVNGFQPITNIRQRPANDDAHCIVQIGLLELVLNVYRTDFFVVGL